MDYFVYHFPKEILADFEEVNANTLRASQTRNSLFLGFMIIKAQYYILWKLYSLQVNKKVLFFLLFILKHKNIKQ